MFCLNNTQLNLFEQISELNTLSIKLFDKNFYKSVNKDLTPLYILTHTLFLISILKKKITTNKIVQFLTNST